MKAFHLALLLCLCGPLAGQGKLAPGRTEGGPPARVGSSLGSKRGAKGVAVAPATSAVAAPPSEAPSTAAPVQAHAKPRVQFVTSYGPVVVELESELAPRTVANFLAYVSEGFYSDTIFHRVISGFMIQGGGLLADLSEKPTHGAIVNEAPETFRAGWKNTRGTIAMARQDKPQTATAQFYINTVDNATLDHRDLTDEGYGYCVFGKVVSGMEVVDKIEKVGTVWRKGMQNVPEYAVRIKSATRLPDEP